MKSQKAKEFIDGCMAHLTVEMSDHAKWQLRAAMTHAAELAEQEMEGFYTCWIDPKDFMPEVRRADVYHRFGHIPLHQVRSMPPQGQVRHAGRFAPAGYAG